MFEGVFGKRKATAEKADFGEQHAVDMQPYVAEPIPGRTAEQAATARAEFARQVTGFVNIGNSEHALELIHYAVLAAGVHGDTPEAQDEIAFLEDLKENVEKVVARGKENTQ